MNPGPVAPLSVSDVATKCANMSSVECRWIEAGQELTTLGEGRGHQLRWSKSLHYCITCMLFAMYWRKGINMSNTPIKKYHSGSKRKWNSALERPSKHRYLNPLQIAVARAKKKTAVKCTAKVAELKLQCILLFGRSS